MNVPSFDWKILTMFSLAIPLEFTKSLISRISLAALVNNLMANSFSCNKDSESFSKIKTFLFHSL